MNKKNAPLIVGIAIPIVMIILVAASIYLPTFFAHPQYSFLYVTGRNYNDTTQYAIQNGQLAKTNVVNTRRPVFQRPTTDESRLFVLDVSQNQSKEISFEDAQHLKLDPNAKSPDAFEVVHGNFADGVFPFFVFARPDYDTVYIRGHNTSKKLNAELTGNNSYNAYYNFRFLGWILK